MTGKVTKVELGGCYGVLGGYSGVSRDYPCVGSSGVVFYVLPS